jgi:hypothetical protein
MSDSRHCQSHHPIGQPGPALLPSGPAAQGVEGHSPRRWSRRPGRGRNRWNLAFDDEESGPA